MPSFLSNLGAIAKNTAMNFWRLPLHKRFLLLISFGLLIVLGFSFSKNEGALTEEAPRMRAVTVRSVSDLSRESSPLPLLGTVVSRNEATIRAEGSGKIAKLHKRLGDFVAAGEVIAEFDNAAERAQVLQAEGSYRSAEAGGDIANINRNSSDLSLGEAKAQALNAIGAAYTTLDDAVRTKTDAAWNNPQTRDAKFVVSISDSNLVLRLEQERVSIEAILRAREDRNKLLSVNSDLLSELSTVESEVKIVKNYLDDLSLAFTRAIPDATVSQATIESYKGATGIARSAVAGALTAVTATRNSLNGSIAANQVAEKNSTSMGGTDLSTSDAGLMSALGNLRSAQARLEKTIIRSPIGGTINSLTISTGDFISPFTEVAVVSNNGALEILTHVTEEDARELSVGSQILIEDAGKGVVTRIAPALDPKTKKIEVRIGITEKSVTLLNGQSVRLEAARTIKKNSELKFKIPLSALKITPEGGRVFTVSASGTLVAHPVKEGALLGENIEIVSGLTSDMRIVVDARGLKESSMVSVTQ